MSQLLARMQSVPLVATVRPGGVLAVDSRPPWVDPVTDTTVTIPAGTFLLVGMGGVTSVGTTTGTQADAVNGVATTTLAITSARVIQLSGDKGVLIIWKL